MENIKSIEYSFPIREKMASLKEIRVGGSEVVGYFFKEDTKIELIDLVGEFMYSVVLYFYVEEKIEIEVIGEDELFFESKEGEYKYGVLITKEGGITEEESVFISRYLKLRLGEDNSARGMVEDIEFMLTAEGKDLGEYEEKEIREEGSQEEYYYPRTSRYKNRAKIRIEERGDEGILFILVRGSIIVLPNESVREYTGSASGTYDRNTAIVNDLYVKGKIRHKGGREYEVIEDVRFGSPSAIGTLITGIPVSGWDFFEGIRKFKD